MTGKYPNRLIRIKKSHPLQIYKCCKATSRDVAFLRQKGLILIRPFLLAFTCTAIFMFPIVSSFLFRHPMLLKTIGFSLYDANFYVEPFFRKVACSRFVL